MVSKIQKGLIVMRCLLIATSIVVLFPTASVAQTTRQDWLETRGRSENRMVRARALSIGTEGNNHQADSTTNTVSGILSLISWRSYPDAFGEEVVVGEVQNVSGSVLSFSRAIFNFYNGAFFVGSDYGYVFGSQNGRLLGSGIYTAVLPPGAVGFFKVWTDLPYAGITALTFASDAETYSLAPVFTTLQAGAVGVAPNGIGGTNFGGTIRNASGSFTTYFTQIALAGSLGGLINDVDFTYVNGATVSLCGTSSTSAVFPGVTVAYSGSFLRPVSAVVRLAAEWDEFGITPAAQSFGVGGGPGSVAVVGNCAWTAVSNTPWIGVTSAASGMGDSFVSFSVASNPGQARVGTMTIAGQTFTVTQVGNVSCTFSVGVPTGTLPSSGGSIAASITTTPGCAWNAGSNVPWLGVSPASGTGSAAVTVSVAANASHLQRSGVLTIAGQSFTISQAPRLGAASDFDGDGHSDVTIFRPSDGNWYVLQSIGEYTTWAVKNWGTVGDIPVPGDYDGDGVGDVAVFRPSTGFWWVWKSSGGYIVQQWGAGGDIPVAGDYDGDGKADPAVYRPSTGYWYVLKSSTSYTAWLALQWGTVDDRPVSGDYDGDGRNDLAVYRPSTASWYVLTSSSSYSAWLALQWGALGDRPVPGDYDGDGKVDISVYRPSSGTWFILKSSSNNTAWTAVPWGVADDVSVPADYDGDGLADVAVYRPSTGTWWILKSSSGNAAINAFGWGTSTDLPIGGFSQ